MTTGNNTVSFAAPGTAGAYNVRFRYTSYNPGTMLPIGEAKDGEVEDLTLNVVTPVSGGGALLIQTVCKDPKATNYNGNVNTYPDNTLCVYTTPKTPTTNTTTTTTTQTTTPDTGCSGSNLYSSTTGSKCPTPKTAPYQFTRILRFGSYGDDVKHLQEFLNTHGSPLPGTGLGSPGHEMNIFGSKTTKALAHYQSTHNITPAAGIFGAKTMLYVNGVL